MTKDEFILRIDGELSKKLEVQSYEMDNRSRNIAFLLSKNVSFFSTKPQEHFEKLTENVIEFERLKDELSTTVAIPAAKEKWEGNPDISWNLSYQNAELTVSKVGIGNKESKEIDFSDEISDDVINSMRELSVKSQVLGEVYAYVASSYPAINTEAYEEFEKHRDLIDKSFEDSKKALERDVITPRVSKEGITSKFTWNLNFDTKKVFITY